MVSARDLPGGRCLSMNFQRFLACHRYISILFLKWEYHNFRNLLSLPENRLNKGMEQLRYPLESFSGELKMKLIFSMFNTLLKTHKGEKGDR